MENKVFIGKYTLESLTNGMYANPQDLFREYIQNAVDSIDNAIEEGVVNEHDAQVSVCVSQSDKSIQIFDNGLGIPREDAKKILLDIGNSKKSFKSRGFRGIGRLSGLGYCDKLEFSTSFIGESFKTIVLFDAGYLRDMLIPNNRMEESVASVITRAVTIRTLPQKKSAHYFKVKLTGVRNNDILLEEDRIKSYLMQNTPVAYQPTFKWGSVIRKRFEIECIKVPTYNVSLTYNDRVKVPIFKPYQDIIIADRVKKIQDNIKDIKVKAFYRGDQISALLWYAETSYHGTILDKTVKGIRVRKGNLLVGGNSIVGSSFKEERFNGWLIGELFVLDDSIFPNARRDDFEQNDPYSVLISQVKAWTCEITKDMRKISYKRSLSAAKVDIISKVEAAIVNDLSREELNCDSIDLVDSELSLMDGEESYEVAQNFFLDQFSILLNQKKANTKYTALNINTRLTCAQRKVLERVFDLVVQEFETLNANNFITTIATKF